MKAQYYRNAGWLFVRKVNSAGVPVFWPCNLDGREAPKAGDKFYEMLKTFLALDYDARERKKVKELR